jgi:Flp pilus assembly protein CpaB
MSGVRRAGRIRRKEVKGNWRSDVPFVQTRPTVYLRLVADVQLGFGAAVDDDKLGKVSWPSMRGFQDEKMQT